MALTKIGATLGGSADVIQVTQSSHGLSLGFPVKVSGNGTYAHASADSATNAEAIGIIIATTTDTMTIALGGRITIDGVLPSGNIAAGTVLFLHTSAGKLTATEPSGNNEVSKPMAVITYLNSEMIMVQQRGEVISTTGITLADGSVDNDAMADDAINTDELVADAVTNAKLANMATRTVKANATSGSANPTDVVMADGDFLIANASALVTVPITGDVVISNAGAATIQTGAVDIAMLSASGSASSSTFLRGNNEWAAAGGDFTNGGDDGALILGTNDTNTLTFETDNTARVVLAAAGDVSIKGTQKLHFGDGTDTYISQTADNRLAFYAGGRHMMHIKAGGVFIGYETGTNTGDFDDAQSLPTAPSEGTGGITQNGLHIHSGDSGNWGPAITFSNSSVNHGITGQYHTATYGDIKKASGGGAGGGLDVRGVTDSNVTSIALRLHGTVGGSVNTGTAVGSYGAVVVLARKANGTDTQALASNENIFSVDNNTNTRFIIKGNGDMYGDTSFSGIGDEYDDAQLIRALDIVKDGHGVKGYIQDKWDNFIQYNEQTLLDAGILGDTLENRGLLNYTGLQKFHSGAIWQLYSKMKDQEEKIALLENKLVALTDGRN